MQERINYAKAAPEVYATMFAVHRFLEQSGLEENLLNLVYLRASQMNGCAYCVDMHWKDLRAAGEPEQKLYMLSAWREWSGYSQREQAALEWTEAVTRLTDGAVPDRIYELTKAQFTDAELATLTLAVAAINSWNRLNVAFRREPGGYQPRRSHDQSRPSS
jgi:AhpD family alkylhydroperoxidase